MNISTRIKIDAALAQIQNIWKNLNVVCRSTYNNIYDYVTIAQRQFKISMIHFLRSEEACLFKFKRLINMANRVEVHNDT